MSDTAKKTKQRWTVEKPKLDNARQLRGIFFIEPNDEEFKLTMKASRRKLEVPMPAAMPGKMPIKSSGKTHRNNWKRKTKCVCVCCCRRKHETKARRSWTRTSSRSHHCKRDELCDSSQSSAHIHSDVSSFEKFQMHRRAVEKELEKLKKSPT